MMSEKDLFMDWGWLGLFMLQMGLFMAGMGLFMVGMRLFMVQVRLFVRRMGLFVPPLGALEAVPWGFRSRSLGLQKAFLGPSFFLG